MALRFSVSMVAVVSLLQSGCGPAEEVRPELIPVQGMLTVNGQPAEGAMVVFHPADGKSFDSRGSKPRATVTADGTFTATTYQNSDGIPAGDYDVSILWFAGPESSNPWDKLGGRYANPESAGIKVTVDAETALVDPIALEGVKVADRPPRPSGSDYDQVD